MKRFIVLMLTLAGCCPGSDSTEDVSPCPVYCGAPVSSDVVSERCAAAFGESFAVPRQCPVGLVPGGCASYTDYSVGFVSTCPDEDVSQNVLCCEE